MSLVPVLVGVIVGLGILLMLVRPWALAEVYWIGVGVLLLFLLRLISTSQAARAVKEGTDVYLFLIGMMLLSELARDYGVFDWLSTAAVRGAKHSFSRLFLLLYVLGTVVTVFMSNDATAVVLTPAVLTVVRKARIEPMPYLFVCAFIANAASFVLPISNPANLVVFHGHVPPLGRWLLWFAIPSIFSIASTYVVMRWIFRENLYGHINSDLQDHALTTDGKLVLGGLGATAIVLITASALGWDLGLPTCVTAIVVTITICLRARNSPLALLREISWSTLALVAGLFVMVAAIENIGALNYTRAWLGWVENLRAPSGALLTGFAIGIANNMVNNLPLGLIAGSTLQTAHAKALTASAVMIGVDVGPNLAITGSLATILWLIALRKEGLDVSFWRFLKVGVVVMPVALLLSIGSLISMHILFGIP